MARRKKDDSEPSMDSLLDALTNVVGVLLLILIISSLGLSQAVKVVVENLPDVTEEDLQELKVRADDTRKNLKELEQASADTKKKPEKTLQQLMLEIDKIENNNKDLAKKNSDMEELQKKIDDEEAQQKSHEEKVMEAAEELAKMKAILAQTPEQEKVAPKVVKMPNPRRASAESRAHYVICKFGKVYYVGDPYSHVLKVRDVIYKNFPKLVYSGGDLGSYTFALQSTRQNKERTSYLSEKEKVRRKGAFTKSLGLDQVMLTEMGEDGIALPEKSMAARLFGNEDRRDFYVRRLRLDPKKVQAFFGKGKLGPRDFSYFVERYGSSDRLKLSLGFKKEGGWKIEQFKKRGSNFDKVCKKVSLQRNALFYYYVSADSFDAYLEARNISESHRIAAGWTTWEGEKFDPKAMPKRETITVKMDAIPMKVYETLVKNIGPKVIAAQKKAITSIDQKIAALVPKTMKDEGARAKFSADLRAEQITYFTRYVQPWTRQIYEAALAASEAKGSKEIREDVHPPEIPHTRLFVKAAFPSKPKPPEDPNKPKPKPKPKAPTGTTLILD
ncbi:MAG: hypothetical protein L3J39_08435 [Verrucomicrobiales bacterium]|nr:hypothetical protein [Verrucomicrobiales bacterium]